MIDRQEHRNATLEEAAKICDEWRIDAEDRGEATLAPYSWSDMIEWMEKIAAEIRNAKTKE